MLAVLFRRRAATLAVAGLLLATPSAACVGTNCMLIWSTADGGGALTIQWDFVNRDVIQTFKALCVGGECLYSTIDPGFMALNDGPPDGSYPLAAGTMVSIEVVAIDPVATVKINGSPLARAGDRALLGTAGTLHVHPTWQVTVDEGVEGDFPFSFKLTTESPLYAESPVYTVRLTNRAPPPTETPTVGPSATPTPTATAAAAACAGDCDVNGTVTVSEIVGTVSHLLDGSAPCPAADRDGDGVVVVSEIIAAVNAVLNGCTAAATPTETPGVTFDAIQASIFSPRCAVATCHDTTVASGDLVLVDADTSYAALVDVDPTIDAAREAGVLRVDPMHPNNSLLMSKLTGPPLGWGSRMPLTGPLLSDTDVDRIRAWILAGAAR